MERMEEGELSLEESLKTYERGIALSRACQHPDNVWSLHGYHECLMRLGRNEEAGIIKQRLDLANGRTDVPVKSSCFCTDSSV